MLRTNRVRADTTLITANVSYPTDTGLLAKAIRRIAATGQRIHRGDAVRPAAGRSGPVPQRRADRAACGGQVVDNDDGIVLDHDAQAGNPPDAPQLAPAVQRIKTRTGRVPRTVTADRGYGEAAVDQALTDLGVRNVVIWQSPETVETPIDVIL